YDPATRGGNSPPDGRKVKSTIHWVSAAHAINAEVRLYETLFTREDPNQTEEGQDFTASLNPRSLEVVRAHAINAEVRLYETLFTREDPNQTEEGQDFTASLNPRSLEVVRDAKLEPSLANAAVGGRYQFERLGYFCVDPDSGPRKPVFNRTVALKDTWAKIEKSSPSRR
ncbi:MAG: hypothetical protein DMG46_21975, partial [Acidobacteria bacterium]